MFGTEEDLAINSREFFHKDYNEAGVKRRILRIVNWCNYHIMCYTISIEEIRNYGWHTGMLAIRLKHI